MIPNRKSKCKGQHLRSQLELKVNASFLTILKLSGNQSSWGQEKEMCVFHIWNTLYSVKTLVFCWVYMVFIYLCYKGRTNGNEILLNWFYITKQEETKYLWFCMTESRLVFTWIFGGLLGLWRTRFTDNVFWNSVLWRGPLTMI